MQVNWSLSFKLDNKEECRKQQSIGASSHLSRVATLGVGA